jgi:hypothetical protein
LRKLHGILGEKPMMNDEEAFDEFELSEIRRKT